MQFISFRVILKRIGAITSLLRDKTVPLRKKALVVFGLVYLFLPVDLSRPILFPFRLHRRPDSVGLYPVASER